MDGADVAHRLAARTHENGVYCGCAADEFHPGQERTVANTRGAEKRAFAYDQIVVE